MLYSFFLRCDHLLKLLLKELFCCHVIIQYQYFNFRVCSLERVSGFVHYFITLWLLLLRLFLFSFPDQVKLPKFSSYH